MQQPQPAEPSKPRLVDRIAQIPKIATGASAVVGLIAGILGIVAVLRHDGGSPPPKAPTVVKQEARIDGVQLENGITLRQYLEDRGSDTSGRSARELATPGVVATVSMTAAALEGRKLLLIWSVVDDASGRRLPGLSNQHAGDIREGA